MFLTHNRNLCKTNSYNFSVGVREFEIHVYVPTMYIEVVHEVVSCWREISDERTPLVNTILNFLLFSQQCLVFSNSLPHLQTHETHNTSQWLLLSFSPFFWNNSDKENSVFVVWHTDVINPVEANLMFLSQKLLVEEIVSLCFPSRHVFIDCSAGFFFFVLILSFILCWYYLTFLSVGNKIFQKVSILISFHFFLFQIFCFSYPSSIN